MRILLVDDDDLVRLVLAEMLADLGHEIVEAAGPQDALGRPNAISSPNLVITDIDLGSSLSGFDVAAKAHLLWPAARVILTSGCPPGNIRQLLDPRDRYLQKPFSAPTLRGAIENFGYGASEPSRQHAEERPPVVGSGAAS
jgi:CheY-like chemotaxis protein